MILYILKNAHSSLQHYADNEQDLHPEIDWCVWREPWQRFISAVWTDVIDNQTGKASHKTGTAGIIPKMLDKDWLRQQMEGDGVESLYDRAGHMITQWNNLQKECHRRNLTSGSVRIYSKVHTATKIHYAIEDPHKINVAPPNVIKKIKDTLIPLKQRIVQEWLIEDYEIWDQLESVPFIDVAVDKIRKDI